MKMVHPDAIPGGWERVLAARAELPPTTVGGLDPEAAGELLRIYHGRHRDVIRLIHDGYELEEIAAAIGRDPKSVEAAVASALHEARRLINREGQRLGQQVLALNDPEPVRPRPPSRAGRPRTRGVDHG